MFDLEKLFDRVSDRIESPTCIVGGSPVQTFELATKIVGPVTCWQPDFFQASRLNDILREHGMDVRVHVTPDVWDISERFRTVLLPIARYGEREFKLDLLEQSFHILEDGGTLLSLSEYVKDQFLPPLHKKIFGKCSEAPASRHGSIFWSKREGDRPRRRHEQTFHAKLREGPGHAFLSRPGVFCYGKMDEGARALLESAEIREGDRIADLGCGIGTNGIFALDRTGPTGRVTFIDSNARALTLAEHNAKANGLTHFDMLPVTRLEQTHLEGFDVVLANPPYYAQDAIARSFIDAAKRWLKPEGRLYLVTKRIHRVAPMLTAVFADVYADDRRGYSILHASQSNPA